MENVDWILEILLVGLLGVTLVHAIRLERALKVLRQDRVALGDAIAGFDESARQAEAGIGRVQFATAETTQLLMQRLEQAGSLRDDLAYLTERGESIADRLDGLVRTSRGAAVTEAPAIVAAPVVPASVVDAPVIAAAVVAEAASAPVAAKLAAVVPPRVAGPAPKVRSQAERDLLLALRGAAQ